MANTPTQNQAAITAAVQASATADLSLLQTFAANNGASFVSIQNQLTALANQMSDLARADSVNAIGQQLANALANFQTLISTTTNAKTATPDV